MGSPHTTNYANTFITVAPDSTAARGAAPPARAIATLAARLYEALHCAPYTWTSDDLLFAVWAERNNVAAADRTAARADFFAKPRACLRSCALGKQYGWGIHFNAGGTMALYGRETDAYDRLASGIDPGGEPVRVVAALRSARR